MVFGCRRPGRVPSLPLRLHQFDENLSAVRRADEKEIDARAVRAGSSCGIYRRNIQPRTEQPRGGIDVWREKFNLLNSFAEFRQESCNRAALARRGGGQNIKVHLWVEAPFEFDSVLVGRNFSQMWLTERGANSGEMFRRDGHADGCVMGDQRGNLRISAPGCDELLRGVAATAKDLAPQPRANRDEPNRTGQAAPQGSALPRQEFDLPFGP